MSKRIILWIGNLCTILLFFSCGGAGDFQDATAAWTFSDVNDATNSNSRLTTHGQISFVTLTGEEARLSKSSKGDGNVIHLTGGWLSAGQGAEEELNITGKNMSILVRLKAEKVQGYTPIINKAGNDQSLAYSVALNEKDGDVYIESMLGSDDIAGSHFLKYKLPKEAVSKWHDIIFRFNGQQAELYVDGILRDDEVAAGEIRDWNRKPVLIGAQSKPTAGYADISDEDIEAKFEGYIDHIVLWSRYLTETEIQKFSGVKELIDGKPAFYSEKYRPQFHFSAKKNWLNDPNGLVYYDGVYHLFFQYLPPHRPGAYKDWGHAVSTDLVHWKQTTDHISPHKVWGGCWSGSAVVDFNNSAGFQSGEKKPVIAFITCSGDNDIGPRATQCIAYSTDGGKTFKYYDQNPVIHNISNYNRDPKVVWDEQSQQWIMSLYMDVGNDFGLFVSKDLKEWKFLEKISLEGVTECPGFEPLPVDGDTSRIKWVFWGANGNYVIGTFNGAHFTPETKMQRGDYGSNFYAAQTWSNAPGGRCLHIAWMPSQRYPGMPFEQQMNFPTELTLRTTKTGIKVFRMPVREIAGLYDKAWQWKNLSLNSGEHPLDELKGDLYDIAMDIDLKTATVIEFKFRNVKIVYDRKQIMLFDWKNDSAAAIPAKANIAPLLPVDGKIKLRILLDRISVEIFGNDGEMVMTSCFMPEDGNTNYSIKSNGNIEIVNAEIHSLKSIWTK